MVQRRDVLTWVLWIALMIIATAVMIRVRDRIDQVHVVLVYLLLILGASTFGGRLLAFPLAGVGFLLIDYYFQQPYDELSSAKPLDWLALTSFLLTAGVATHLLVRAQTEAEEAAATNGRSGVAGASRLGNVECGTRRGRIGANRRGHSKHTRHVGMSNRGRRRRRGRDTTRQRALVLPLSVQGRTVGTLHLGNDAPIVLDPPQRRFLDAITYYAALAIDRVRLVAEAEHAEALREADRLKDIVLASVSHDLRTPLTTIKALAQSEALQGNSAGAAIEEQADRLTRLVSDLLDLSRLKGGGFAAHPELNTADDLVGAAVRQTRGLFGEHPLRTVIDLDSPALVGHFDFSQSLRVLCNLLENARRYSPPREAVELAARRDGDTLVFSVSDRGPGVADPDVARIFEPFYRAQASAPDSGRAGLGLSIARTLAEIQGGSVDYERRSGGGSVFSLRLPATELRPDALDQPV